MMQFNIQKTNNRHALTMMELSVATLMVGALLVMGMKMITSVKRNQGESERREVAAQRVANLMEQVALLDPVALEEMTNSQREEAGLKLDAEILESLPGAKLEIEVKPAPTDKGAPASHRVAITLSWETGYGEPARPLKLVSWVADRLAQSVEATAESEPNGPGESSEPNDRSKPSAPVEPNDLPKEAP